MEKIYISRLELQRWFLEFIISFLRYIFRIWIEVWLIDPNLACSDEFSGYILFPNSEKFKFFEETFTP